jgi:hydrogenase-4 membrane subunit HyfE
MTAFVMAKQDHVGDNINTYRLQSLCIFILNILLLTEQFSEHLLISALIVLIFKVIALPKMIKMTLKKLHIQDQFENIVNIQFIFIAIGVLTAFSFLLFPRESLDFLSTRTYHVIPITFAMCFIGCEMAVDFTPNSGGTLQAMAHVLYNYTKH